MNMRLDKQEKEALKYALRNFRGKVFLYGSRLDDAKKGGDIDIILVPDEKTNALDLSLEIQTRFFKKSEQRLDVLVYSEDKLFCQEVMKYAKRLYIRSLS